MRIDRYHEAGFHCTFIDKKCVLLPYVYAAL